MTTLYALVYSLFRIDVITYGQPGAAEPNFNEQLRNLNHGKINFLHTTDTHGWYLGHVNQKQYSADWGDFISFHTRLRDVIEGNGGDLLLVDSGDRHDGNGLSDLTTPNGLYSTEIFTLAEYDIVTPGNHELYVESISTAEYDMVVSIYGDRFISTNVRYLNDESEWVVFGNNTHRYFQTRVNQLNVLSFSFLFDFKWFNQRVDVIPIIDVLEASWFVELVEDYSKNYPVDLILIVGHLPVSHDWLEMYRLHAFFRQYFPQTVIQYFGGHSHIRDFSMIDDYATGLQSGRYCETVGFLSIQNLPKDEEYHIVDEIDRKYIDFNIHSFMNHTGVTNEDEFHTKVGKYTSKKLTAFAKLLGLNDVYGHVPQNYYVSAADYTNNDPKSLLRLLENQILPQLTPKSCTQHKTFVESDSDRIILINTGGIRYDLYKGEFTKNALFTVSPFKNKWRVIPDVPSEIALQLKDILNAGDIILNYKSMKNPEQYAVAKQIGSNEHIESHNISYGHTTKDDLGVEGDDTIHKPLPNYYVPNVIQSYGQSTSKSEFTNVVYYDFIEPFILHALEIACNNNNSLYLDLSSKATIYNDCSDEWNLGQMLKRYVVTEWS